MVPKGRIHRKFLFKEAENCNSEMFQELTDLSSTEIKEKTMLKAPSYYHDFI